VAAAVTRYLVMAVLTIYAVGVIVIATVALLSPLHNTHHAVWMIGAATDVWLWAFMALIWRELR
jgi:hypothetical protein